MANGNEDVLREKWALHAGKSTRNWQTIVWSFPQSRRTPRRGESAVSEVGTPAQWLSRRGSAAGRVGYDQVQRRLVEDRINIQKTGNGHEPVKDSVLL
jgi:hypothetical protein